jgi:hypothetical protein
MTGREDKNANNLFFLCSLIEYIGRKTKNHRNVVANAIGKEELQHIFDLADIYHSENMDKLAFEFIEKYNIEDGIFDNVANAQYSVPTHWDIGKVYKRLIINVNRRGVSHTPVSHTPALHTPVSHTPDKPIIDTLLEVYNSWLSRKIEDFNSSVYYESPEYLFQSYLKGENL